MSSDEEFKNSVSETLLINILKSREDAVSSSELWAILKETCVALQYLSSKININDLLININSLLIDTSGNIQIDIDSRSLSDNENGSTVNSYNNNINNDNNSNLIKSIGKTMMYILHNFSCIDSNDNLYQFVVHLLSAKQDDDYDISSIELYADGQLNRMSVDILSNDYFTLKKSDEVSSEIKDSVQSIEGSMNTYSDSVSGESLCLTKEKDTTSDKCPTDSLIDNSEHCFLSLNQLWSHSKESILCSDKECLILLYAILKQVSNSLLNESHSERCICLSVDNILLDATGKLYLNFFSDFCPQCLQEKDNVNLYDIKYINTVGLIIYEVILSDTRATSISKYILLMLQRMINCEDMIINDVLQFCKSNIVLDGVKCRSVLKSLFERWKYWHTKYLRYLSRLKNPYMYDISTLPLYKSLKKVQTKFPMTAQEIFHQNPTLLTGLKYVTKLSKLTTAPHKRSTYPYKTEKSSAFQPYKSQNNSQTGPGFGVSKPYQLKDDTHFRPLVLTSECNSVYQSQDNILSPIGVQPQYSRRVHCCSYNKCEFMINSQKQWQSVIHLPNNEVNKTLNRMASKHQLSSESSNHFNSTMPAHSLTLTRCNTSLKINTIIDIIQSNLTATHSHLSGHILNDHYILTVADFVLSLESITEDIFFEAIKQRFIEISWAKESLQLLYDTINGRVINHTDSNLLISNNYEKSDNRHINDNNVDSLFHGRESCTSLISKNSNTFEDVDDEFSNVDKDKRDSDENVTGKSPNVVSNQFQSLKSSSETNRNQNNNSIIENDSSEVIDISLSETVSSFSKKEIIQMQLNLENSSFFASICPCTVLCFPATAALINPDRNPIVEFSINANNVQEIIAKFFNLNQSIQFQSKELRKTISLIGKYGGINSKKIKKQYFHDQSDLLARLELIFINQMGLESLIVEYYSTNIEIILQEIKSHCSTQAIRFANEIRNFRNLQLVEPYALVTCLFCKGAVTSGLLYDFLLIYREFYTSLEFATVLSNVFNDLQQRLINHKRQLINAKFRLLFIILCWIDGFYKIDFTDLLYSKVMSMVKKNLISYIKNCNEIVEKTFTGAKNNDSASALLFQFISFKDGNLSTSYTIIYSSTKKWYKQLELIPQEKFHNQISNIRRRIEECIEKRKVNLIPNVDIENVVYSIDQNRREKQKLYMWLNINVDKPRKPKNQDVLSILDFSAKDLAVSLSLMEQNLFNNIHPCHLLLYINSLTCTEESILQTIKSHRFSPNSPKGGSTHHKEILMLLRHSGKVTHWAISEILRSTDSKLQAKIVKVLVITCICCLELNNYSTTASILEALQSVTLKWAPFWAHVKPKTIKILKDLDTITNQFSRNNFYFTTNDKCFKKLFLNGSPFLPCVHSILVNLKLTMVGKTITKDKCLKWTKLKKITDILDQIRLSLQFKYISNNLEINKLKHKLSARIDHLTSISLDILQSHNMLAQEP